MTTVIIAFAIACLAISLGGHRPAQVEEKQSDLHTACVDGVRIVVHRGKEVPIVDQNGHVVPCGEDTI